MENRGARLSGFFITLLTSIMDTQLTPVQIKLINLVEIVFKPLTAETINRAILATADIYEKLQSIWPDREAYTSFDVLVILQYLKYDGVHGASENYFWLLEEI